MCSVVRLTSRVINGCFCVVNWWCAEMSSATIGTTPMRVWFRLAEKGSALSWIEAPDGDTATGVTLETSERNTIELVDINRIQLIAPAAANAAASGAADDDSRGPSPAPVASAAAGRGSVSGSGAGKASLILTCDDRRIVLTAAPASNAANSAAGGKKTSKHKPAATGNQLDDWYIALRYAHRNFSIYGNPSVPVESEHASDERGNSFVASLWNRIEDLERDRKTSGSRSNHSAHHPEVSTTSAPSYSAERRSSTSEVESKSAAASASAAAPTGPAGAPLNPEELKALAVPGARARRASGIRADTISGLLPDASDRAIIERNLFRQKTFAPLSADPDVMRQKALQEKKARDLIARSTLLKQSRTRDIEAAASHIADNEQIMDRGDALIAEIDADTKSEPFIKAYGHLTPSALQQLRSRTHDEVERAKLVVGQWTKVREEARVALKEADRVIREKEQLLVLAEQAATEREQQLVNQNSKSHLPDFDRGREFFCMTTAAILHKLQLRGVIEDSRKESWAFSLFDIAILEGVPFHEWNEWVMERVIAMKRDKDRQRQEQALIEQRQRDGERQRLAALEHELQDRKRAMLALRSGPMMIAPTDDDSGAGPSGRARNVSGVNGTIVKIVNPADVRAAVPLDHSALAGGLPPARAQSRSVFGTAFAPNRPTAPSHASGPSTPPHGSAPAPAGGPTPLIGPGSAVGATPYPLTHQLSAGHLSAQAKLSAEKKKQEEGCIIA